MFIVKEFLETSNNEEFYRYMGRFFAERHFRRELPYLINDSDKIWYLFFDEQTLAGFVGVVMNQNGTTFNDFYLLPTYRNVSNMRYIAHYMFEMYSTERIRILSDSKEELMLWEELGFQKSGNKGRYTSMIYEDNVCV